MTYMINAWTIVRSDIGYRAIKRAIIHRQIRPLFPRIVMLFFLKITDRDIAVSHTTYRKAIEGSADDYRRGDCKQYAFLLRPDDISY